MLKGGIYTVSEFAKMFVANRLPIGDGISQEARVSLVSELVLGVFSTKVETEFPSGSGVFYLRVRRGFIRIRLDPRRIRRAKRFAQEQTRRRRRSADC